MISMMSFTRHTLSRAAVASACVLVFVATPSRSFAQTTPDVLQSDESQVADELGNARFNMKLKLSAKQYQAWKQKYGTNPSILRRDMGRLTSQYETSNFKLEQDDMEREVRISLDARGVVTHKGGGDFEFKVPKDWTGGQRVGNEYRFSYVQGIGPGAIMQHNVSTVLPARATNIRDQLSEEGEKLIQYTLPQSSHGTLWIIGTAIFSVIGVAGVAMGLLGKSSTGSASPSA